MLKQYLPKHPRFACWVLKFFSNSRNYCIKFEIYFIIKERLSPDKQNYIFLDEVQLVDGFEKVVNSLYLRKNVDICIC